MNHYDVVFATPGKDMHRDYVMSLVSSCAWLAEQGKTFTLINRTSSFVASAREWTAVFSQGSRWDVNEIGSGAFTYDRLVWIDSDICWEVSALEKLLSHDLDIVSGVMPVDTSGRVGMTRFGDDGAPGVMDWTDLMFEDDLLQVDGVSFGFLAVKNGVFEKMPRPWFKIQDVPVKGYSEDFRVNLGEDYSWCLNAQSAGFKIWVDKTVTVEHVKEQHLRF